MLLHDPGRVAADDTQVWDTLQDHPTEDIVDAVVAQLECRPVGSA